MFVCFLLLFIRVYIFLYPTEDASLLNLPDPEFKATILLGLPDETPFPVFL